MKSPPWIYPQFISPMSGRINNQGVQALTTDYIFLGDNNGFVIESPILIDVRLELIRIRNILGTTSFLLKEATAGFDNSQALDEVSNGLIMNENGIIVPAFLTENNFWVGSSENRPVETSTIPGGAISLLYNNVFVGNISNLATAQPTINFDNLPALTNKKIWRGNIFNRPVESDDLTNTENSLSTTIENLSNLANIVSAISNTVDALGTAVNTIEQGLTSIGGFAAILFLQGEVLGLIGAVGSLSSRMSTAEGHINDILAALPNIYNDLTNIHNDLTSIHNQLTNIENNIDDIEADIVTINSQITEINNDIDDINNDIADINTRIDNLSATFIGDVQGSGLISAPINLELMLTLDQIKKAEDTVDLNENKIINLISDDVEQLDALNAKFLWDLMHDNVGVVWA